MLCSIQLGLDLGTPHWPSYKRSILSYNYNYIGFIISIQQICGISEPSAHSKPTIEPLNYWTYGPFDPGPDGLAPQLCHFFIGPKGMF